MNPRDVSVFDHDDEDYEPGVYDLLARERQKVKFKANRNQQARDSIDNVTVQRRDFARDPKAPRPYPKLAPFLTRTRGRVRDRAYGSWLGQEPDELATMSSEEARDLWERERLERFHGLGDEETFPVDADPRRRNTDGSRGGIAPSYGYDAPPSYRPPTYAEALKSAVWSGERAPERRDSGLSSTSSVEFGNDLRMERSLAQNRRVQQAYEREFFHGGRYIRSEHVGGRHRDSTHRR